MAKQNGATIYYIYPGSPEVHSLQIMQYKLKGGATYRTEALWKMPENVEHYEVVLFEQAGTDYETAVINRLKELALKNSAK